MASLNFISARVVLEKAIAVRKKELKVKLSLCMPPRLQEAEAPRIFRNAVHNDGKVASLTHRPPLPPRRC
jgi:hypothetical protein